MSDTSDVFPLEFGQRAEIVNRAIADEALDLWADGIDFVDMSEDPIFKSRTARLVSSEMMEAAAQTVEEDPKIAEVMQQVTQLMEKQVGQLMAQGHGEEEARKIVKGELLRAFVQVQSEKE